MKKHLIIAIAAVLLIGCKKKDDVVLSIAVDFEYTRISPMAVKFINNSTGCTEYKWDFGDGTYAYGKDGALHEYESVGKYPVTLIGTANGHKYEYTKTVVIAEPEVYFAGFRLYKIPYENRYYKLIFKDDNLLPSSWDFQTTYTPLLTNSDMPYTFAFSTPRRLVDINSHNQYVIQVMRTTNASSSDNDVQCLKQALKVKEIKTYQTEYVLRTSTDGTAVGILMYYEY